MAKLKAKSNRFPGLVDHEIQLATKLNNQKRNISPNRKFFYFVAYLASALLLAFIFLVGNLSTDTVASLQNFLDAIPFADFNISEKLISELKFPNAVTNTLGLTMAAFLSFIVFDSSRKKETSADRRNDLLNESSSVSYAIHILILLIILVAILFNWKAKPKVKVTSIEYIPTQVPSRKKPSKSVKRKAAKQSIDQGKNNPKKKITPISKPAGKPTTAAKPKAKPLPKPKPTPKPKSAAPKTPSPKPISKPTARPKPVVKPRPQPKLNRPAINQAEKVTAKPLPKLMNYGSSSAIKSSVKGSSAPAPKATNSGQARNSNIVSRLSNIPRAPETSSGGYGMPGAGVGGASGANGNPAPNQYADRAPSIAAQADVDFGPYMSSLQRKIKRAWKPPRGTESNRIVVSFGVRRDGSLAELKLIVKSPYPDANLAALDAVSRAAPFDRLPNGSGDLVDIEFTFDYNVFQRSR